MGVGKEELLAQQEEEDMLVGSPQLDLVEYPGRLQGNPGTRPGSARYIPRYHVTVDAFMALD